MLQGDSHLGSGQAQFSRVQPQASLSNWVPLDAQQESMRTPNMEQTPHHMRTFCLSAVKGQQKGPVFTSSRFLRGALVAPYHFIWEGSASLDPVPRVLVGVPALTNPPLRRGRHAATEKLGKVSWINPVPGLREVRTSWRFPIGDVIQPASCSDSKRAASSSYGPVFSVLDPSAALDGLGKGWGTTGKPRSRFLFGHRARQTGAEGLVHGRAGRTQGASFRHCFPFTTAHARGAPRWTLGDSSADTDLAG